MRPQTRTRHVTVRDTANPQRETATVLLVDLRAQSAFHASVKAQVSWYSCMRITLPP
jgi:hypothetical protein